MEVRVALKAALAESGWSLTKAAAAVGLSEAGLRKFVSGNSATLKSDSLLILMKDLPGFAARLGFEATDRAA